MRVLYACCVVLFSAAFGLGPVSAQERQAPGNGSSSCDQCSTLVEQHELLLQKIVKLRARRKTADARETSLIRKRQARQNTLLKLQARHASLQQDELKLAKQAEPSAKTKRAELIKARKKIEREEFEVRADLSTLAKAIPQAQASARQAEQALDSAINERLTIMQAMANCERRCIVADTPGRVVFTAGSLAEVAKSNRNAIRQAARNNAACRDCTRLRDQIEAVTRRIADRQNAERGLRRRMTELDRERQGIRNEWRDLYDRYSDRLLARLNNGEENTTSTRDDRELGTISRQIVNVNGRWQRLLTREGQLQDQLMESSNERARLGKERRRLRAALGACEELCVAGTRDPANAGLRLASGRINIAQAEAKCPRCGALARLVNDATAELGTLTAERDTLQARFKRVAPALEQIRARRRSIIRYAGELADLMDDFRQSGDVARAKRELAQISERSQRLSTDIIRLLEQREKLEERVDANADTITRLSILSRQRRRELKECEERCNAPEGTETEIALVRPDLTFEQPATTQVRCSQCATHGRIIDQLLILQQSEQASLTVADGQLKLHQARLVQVDTALAANTKSIRDTRNNRNARGTSERRNLIEGLQGEARAIRAERNKLRTSVEGARASRDAIRQRVTDLTTRIRERRRALQACESACRIAAVAPAETLQKAQSLIRNVATVSTSCANCATQVSAMREFAADVRSDTAKLERANRTATRAASLVTNMDRRLTRNRTTVLAGVRRWFDLEDNTKRAARTKAVIDEAFQTARLARTANENADTYIGNAAERDKAQASLSGTLPSLEAAIRTAQQCAERCDEDTVSTPELDLSEFQENNPQSLVVAVRTPINVQPRCRECDDKAEALNQLRNQRAVAAARVATARNVTRSAGTLNRKIAARTRETRSRVAKVTEQRFREESTTRKAALKTRLDLLQTQIRQLDRAKSRQDNRLRQAARDIDAARQDIRRLDREISDASNALSSCNRQCTVETADGSDAQDPSDTDANGKSTARLPGASSDPDDTRDAAQPKGDTGDTGTNVADTGTTGEKDTTPGSDSTTRADAATPATPVVSTACKRCDVFAKRIAKLDTERNARRSVRDKAVQDRQRLILAIRKHSGSDSAKTVLVRDRRKLTRQIEAYNASLDRIESRLRRLRASLARCEQVCKVPQDIADASDAVDPDTTDGDSRAASDEARAPKRRRSTRKRRRTSEADIILADADLPSRKQAPEPVTLVDRVLGGLPQVFGSLERLTTGEWETSVDVAVGKGNVWAPETASITVTPGSGDAKLDATIFAATVTARSFGLDGEGTVAWGSLKVTRADNTDAEPAGMALATRTTDYNKVRGTLGIGRETYDCLEGRGSCSLGILAGLEHTSLDDRVATALSSQSTSVDNTAALFGVWGETRIPLGGLQNTGLALVLKGDAYVKGGHAKGTITTAVVGGTTSASASDAYLGVGADLAAEVELSFGNAAIALGGEIGVDTLPTIDLSGGTPDLGTDSTTSSTIYLRGKIKF